VSYSVVTCNKNNKTKLRAGFSRANSYSLSSLVVNPTLIDMNNNLVKCYKRKCFWNTRKQFEM